MDDYDSKIEQNVDSIINQLKNKTNSLREVKKDTRPQLKKEDMEQYIIDKTSEIVDGCVDVIGVIQDEIKLAPDPKLIESGATFINAFASALDALNKLEINKQKINAQKEIKKMDHDTKLAKIETNTNSNQTGLYVSREELIKGILEYKKDEVREISEPPIDV